MYSKRQILAVVSCGFQADPSPALLSTLRYRIVTAWCRRNWGNKPDCKHTHVYSMLLGQPPLL